jgi:hypothetical protein
MDAGRAPNPDHCAFDPSTDVDFDQLRGRLAGGFKLAALVAR